MNDGVIQGDLPGQAALRDWISERARYWDNPPFGTCEGCGREDAMLGSLDHSPGPEDATHCADCRVRASNRRANGDYPCDVCGAPGAFRDPLHRRDEYRCRSCHFENGYEPTERAMVFKTKERVGVVHSQGTRDVCIAAGYGTDCKGQTKPRGKFGVLCDRHHDPRKYIASRHE